jgi:p-aminobenzoyl-glutamate transporter AbgT
MKMGLSAEFSCKAGPEGHARLVAHGLGFAGANLIFGAVFVWGFPLFHWAVGQGWAATAVAEAVLIPLAAILGDVLGTTPFATMLVADAALCAAFFLGGLALLVKGARMIARQQ